MFQRILTSALLVILAAGLLASAAAAESRAIPVKGDRSVLDHETTAAGDLIFRVEVGDLQAMDVQTRGGEFTRLLLPGFHSSQDVGRPELPMLNRLVAIPAGATAAVEIVNVRSRTVKLSDHGITNPIMPAQPGLAKNQRPEDVPFAYDPAAYAQPVAKAAPELVRLMAENQLRAVRFARLEVAPVEYLPASGELRIVDELEFRVRFDGADKALADELYGATYSPFFEHLYARIAGADAKAFQDAYPDRVADVVKLVIVTPPEFAGQLADFAAWKTERGFQVIMAVTGTPEVGTTTSSIQSYLHGLYNDATVDDPAPSFVIFVGDVAQLPTFFESGDATDRPYCAVDGDLVPDMYYGRFSATNPSQLQAILDKTMMYDQYTMPDPSYLDEVVMIAGMDSGYGASHGNGQINYGTEHYFNAAHGITSNTYLYPVSGSSSSAIVADISDGVAFANYTAHGSQTSWSDPSFTQANINGLNNSGKYLLAIGNCCLTSTYDYSECFAETWLRAEDKGAIGYIGGSNSTYWDEDYWFGVGYHASSQIDGTAWPYESTSLGAYDGLFHDHGEAEHLHYVTNDAIVFAGNLAVMESGSTRTTYYWNIYNLMGDPSLSTYLGVPAANGVTLPGVIYTSDATIGVTADPGSYVGVTQAGDLVGAGTVDAGGSLDVDVLQALTPGVPLKFVVMAQNRVPFVQEVMVSVPAVVTVTPTSFPANMPTDIQVTVLDADGVTPVPGVDVSVEWPFGQLTPPVPTDANGELSFGLNVPYGGELTVVGKLPADEHNLFERTLTVTAAGLASPDLSVATEFGLVDLFALNLVGTVTATTGTPGAELVAILPDGTELTSTTGSLDITPTAAGEIACYIRASGYELYGETFPILTTGSVRGTANKQGTTDDGGVTITASPGGLSVVTAGDGSYHLLGLEAGTYTLTASCVGFAPAEQIVTLDEGEHLADVNFSLAVVYEVDICDTPSLAIPDNDPTGVTATIECAGAGEITGVEVAIDLTHTYIGDLLVRLTSPQGTTVVLHDRSGSYNDDIVGTYPLDLAPAESLDAFLGEEMQGTWTMFVSDNVGWDTGTLNEWCLNISFAPPVSSSADSGLPSVLSLGRNYPNPFNPMTTINFDLPRDAEVDLSVYNVRGQKVATLVNGAVRAGTHTTVWRGRDQRGLPVASGTYFYRLTVEGRHLVGKMLLLK